MNTTFTNYAEKKAKQILNLLQGYTKGIRITAILILLLMGVSIPTNAGVFLAGSMNGWSTDANELKSVATDTWRSDIYLEANTTYEFKIVYNGTYCGNGGTIDSNITNWGFTWGGGNNCTIKTSLAGPYTFQWVGNGNKLSVTYPTSKTYTVTVPEGTPDCYICGDMTKWDFRQMTKENNTEYKITINSTNTAEYKYACASSWGFQELNGNCNGTISNRTYNANDNVLCWSLKTIYFKPNSDWKKANARFEVNWWIDGESHSGWVDLVQTECDDYYVAQVPLYKAKVKFCRTDPNNFNNKWNTIDNQTVPTDDNNLFTVTGWESGNWSNLDVVSITTNNPENGTIEVSRAAVNIGETVTVTITPDNNYRIKSYTIGSSTTNVSETGAKSFDLTICSNTTISAEFETTKSKYTVSFNMNGHGDAIAAQEITEGEKVAKPTDPTATGYTFGDWYKEANCTNAWNFNTDVVTGNMTLYAKWTATEYTITYNDLYGVTHSNPETYTIETETITFAEPTSTRTGYTFDVWNPTKIEKGSTDNKTVTAQWTANQYDITYKDQGGSDFSGTHSGNPPTKHTYGTTTTLKTATKTGYTFGGWYKEEEECTNKVTSLGATDYINNITLYAKWTINTYTITFGVKDGGGTVKATVDGSEIASGAKVEYNKQVVFTAIADANNVFSKWVNGSGTQISTQNPYTHTVSSDATIKAVFLKPTTIYLKPSSVWKQANARFAIYYWGADEKDNGWVDMTPVGCNDEYYMADVPAGYSQFKFVRLNPATTENSWGNRWAETGNLTIPNNENNMFDMTQIYLEVNNWDVNDANERYAAYFYVKNGGDKVKWMSMLPVKDDIYKCDIPSEHNFDWVIFGRMNGAHSDNRWNTDTDTDATKRVWNQTADLEITSDHYTHGNYFTITKFENGNTEGSWSWNDIAWTKLDLPTITYDQPENGSVTVTTASGKAITTGSSVEFDTEIIVTVTPNAGYAVNTATITIGGKQQTLYSGENTVTVCGNTRINVSFKQKAEWYIIGIDGNWGLQEKYKFIDGRVYVDLGEKADKTFKIAKASGGSVDNENQYGNKTFQGHDNSHTLTPANSLGGDATIKMVHNGGYVFVWDEDTKKLTIEYPNVCYLHGEFNDWKDNEAHALHNQVAMVKLDKDQIYEFKIADTGIYRTSNAWETQIIGSTTITMDDATAYQGKPWHNCQIKATVTGIYRFSYNRETHVLVITYPEGSEPRENDYRLAYKNNTSGSFHPAHFIRKNTTASEKLDTVSFFVDTISMTPQIILQKCTNVSNGKGTWEDISEWQNISAEAAGVYNFVLKQTNSGDTHHAEIDMSKKHAYTGHYYIRTNCAAGGWEAYNVASSMMTYSSYADKHENFDHYYCEWVEDITENVSFTIANDYSYCVSDTMTTDDIATNSCLPNQQASVRFGWDSKSNELSRAYLSGATNISDRFLVLIGDTKLKDANGHNFHVEGLNQHETNFADLQNWIYQVDVTASKDTYVKLTAKYDNTVQYFHGSESAGEQLLTSSDASEYKMRIIYDFKTNHLVAAWLGGGNTIEGENRELGAEMMIIRKNQNKAEQLLFNPNTNTLGSVETVYAVTTFTKDFITSDRTQYERALYWVSFPFDVRIGEVFGFGEYGDHWIIQYYDGAARAKYGLFEDSGTYWRYITSTDSVLHKNTGYVLTLDLDKVAQSFLYDATEVSLYFPSTDDLGTITGTPLPQSVSVTGHKCEIVMTDATNDNRRDRTIYDSHWNMIGVPVFADVNGFLTDSAYVRDGISFYYEYLPATNSYQATNKTANFQTMYGYMVQFAGTINWSSKDVTFNPNQKLAAHRNSESDEPEKVSLRLEIAQDDVMADQTFVQLQQEGATAEFDMNLDLTKIINSGANIYTLAGEQRIQSAGNALPMGEAVVPVGVKIATEGEYTLRMPDGTEGMVVELLDYETNTRTNLLLDDYTITLSAGSYENRFALHIQPQKDVTTGVGNVGDRVKGIEKYLIDGKLIIRTAEGIFDAQGHRL